MPWQAVENGSDERMAHLLNGTAMFVLGSFAVLAIGPLTIAGHRGQQSRFKT